MDALAILIALPLVIAIGSAIDAFVLSTLWGWFMVPLFNLPALGMAAAWGVALVVRALRPGQFDTKEDNRKESWSKVITLFLLTPALTLLLGWIAKSLM